MVPSEATGKGTASVAAEVPGLKQSWRDVEAWHHAIRLEYLQKPRGGYW